MDRSAGALGSAPVPDAPGAQDFATAQGSAAAQRSAAALRSAVVRDRLRERGMRWTPQRRDILAALETTEGHVTGSDLVERCRAKDPEITPSTVYRTLDVLEELGIVSHSHGADGREEYHVLPRQIHGHMICQACATTTEMPESQAEAILVAARQATGFEINLSHLTLVGICGDCQRAAAVAESAAAPARPASQASGSSPI